MRNRNFAHRTRVAWILLLAFSLYGMAQASVSLDDWRAEAASTRHLAENDVPAAYREAQRLHAAIPAEATPADQALALNLRAVTALHMALSGESGELARQALALAERHGDRIGQAEALLCLALNEVNQGRIDGMNAAVVRAMEVLDGVDRPDLLAEVIYQALGDLDHARVDAEQAFGLAREIGTAVYQSDSARRLAALSAAVGHHEKAYRLLVEATETTARATDEQISRRMSELAERYETEAKQRRIDELTRQSERQGARQRIILTVLTASVLLLAITVFFLLRLRQSREHIRALNAGLEQRVEERTVELRQSRQRLAEALEFTEGIIHAIPDVLLEMDREGRYLNVWARDPQLLAAQREALLGRTVHEVLSPENAAAAMEAIREAEAKGFAVGRDICIELPQGKRWFAHTLSRKQGETSAQTTILALSRDITERMLMEIALKESEARYRHNSNLLQSIIESPSSSVSIYALDHEYRFMAFNSRFKAAAKRLWHADITLGMSMLNAVNNEAHRAFCKEGFDQVLAGRSYTLDSVEDRIEDGKTIREYHENHGSPILGDNGEIIGLTLFVLNTTERKRTELRLKEALEFTEGVINAIPDLLFEVDREGRYLNIWTHTPELLSAQKAVLLGKTVHDALMPESAATVMEALREAEAQGVSFGKVIQVDLPHGTSWFELSISRRPGGGPTDMRFLALSRDVTERMRFEAAREAALDEAVRLAKQRRDFLSHMSHELRTPLNGILGYAQLLQHDPMLTARHHEALNVVRQSGEHLLSLIDDVLDMARIDAGRFRLDDVDITIATFLRVVCDIVRVRARDKAISFECELLPGLPAMIRGDEKRLRQVLLNLLSNAVKFTDQGGVVLRVARIGPSRILFEVTDTGRGIADADLESVFQPFARAGNLSQSAAGTGLGLSISRQLVRLMGGDISVESRLGQGSTFRFELESNQEAAKAGVALAETVLQIPLSEGELARDPALVAPPQAELRALHHLALMGNMRDIIRQSGHVESLDPRYRPFAERLRQLAGEYQSKAVLALIESHLNDSVA